MGLSVSPEAKRWLGKDVRALAAYDHRVTHAVGRVVGYCAAPQVTIETEDGEKVQWRADLCEVVPETVEKASRQVERQLPIRVRAFYSEIGFGWTRGEGEVVGHSRSSSSPDTPERYLISSPGGHRFWWPVDACEVLLEGTEEKPAWKRGLEKIEQGEARDWELRSGALQDASSSSGAAMEANSDEPLEVWKSVREALNDWAERVYKQFLPLLIELEDTYEADLLEPEWEIFQ